MCRRFAGRHRRLDRRLRAAVATVPRFRLSCVLPRQPQLCPALSACRSATTSADRDAVIAAFEEALEGTPVDSPERPGSHGPRRSFAPPLRFRWAATDLDRTIAAFQEHWSRPLSVRPTVRAIFTTFGADCDVDSTPLRSADLDASIAACQEAVDATPADDPDRSARLSSLARLQRRYQRGRASTDLDAAVATFAQASTPPRRLGPTDPIASTPWAGPAGGMT